MLDPEDPDYGLLDDNNEDENNDEPMRFLSYSEYPKSNEADNKAEEKSTLILVHFSDRILNKKAQDIKMKVHLQDKFQTLPFVLDAQQEFVRFNAS